MSNINTKASEQAAGILFGDIKPPKGGMTSRDILTAQREFHATHEPDAHFDELIDIALDEDAYEHDRMTAIILMEDAVDPDGILEPGEPMFQYCVMAAMAKRMDVTIERLLNAPQAPMEA